MAIRILTWRQYSTKIEFFTAFYVNYNSADGFKDQFVEFKQLQSAVEECDVVHLGQCVQTISHGCRSFRQQDDSPTSRFAYTIVLLERGICGTLCLACLGFHVFRTKNIHCFRVGETSQIVQATKYIV